MIYASGEKHVYLHLLNRGEQFLKYIEVNLKMEHVPPCAINLSHGRYFRQFWGTATFTSECLHTARCNRLYL